MSVIDRGYYVDFRIGVACTVYSTSKSPVDVLWVYRD